MKIAVKPNFRILLATFVLDGCAHWTTVDTPEAAIAIADKACADSWGHELQKYGSQWTTPSDWQARLAGDHWKVWAGKESDPSVSVNVPKSGKPVDPDTSCSLKMPD